MEDLIAFLNKMSTPALVFQNTNNGSWQVVQWNLAFNNLREGMVDGLENTTPRDLYEVQSKGDYPVYKGGQLKAGTPIAPCTAMLEKGNNEQVRVKIKHDWVDEQTLLLWVEPFSEDMALTQAHADFVSVVSHEFRTPLTSIKGFADTLLRYGTNIDPEQQKRFVNIIKHQADRLTRLVENLLTVSKLGAQRVEMSFRPIPLKKVVERIIQSVEAKLTDPREFIVEIPEDVPEVWADPDKLEQVLLNLIDNAAKYSYANSQVRVKALLDPADDDKVNINIADQGVGIPADHLPNIFSKFSRIDNPLTREVEGTGLGLYITKSLTNAMGGDITAESEVDKGTTFTVIMPVATPERQAAHQLQSDNEDMG